MKRVMMLALLLCTGSMAIGGLILNPNGSLELGPTDIDVVSTGQITGFEFEIRIEGGVMYGEPVFPETWMFTPYVKSRSDSHIEVTGGDFFPKAGPLTVMTGLTFVENMARAGIITLRATGSNNVDGIVIGAGTVLDWAIIIPEPTSVMLLGLGCVLIRRRR